MADIVSKLGIYYVAPLLGPVVFTLCRVNFWFIFALGFWVHIWRCIDIDFQLARHLLVPFCYIRPEPSLLHIVLPRHVQAGAQP